MSLPQEIYELGKNIHKSQKFSENKICFNKIKDLNLLNPIFQTDIDENKINEMVSSYLKNPDYFYFKNKIVVAVINHYNDLYSLYLIDGQHRVEASKKLCSDSRPNEYLSFCFYLVENDKDMENLFSEVNKDSYRNITYISLPEFKKNIHKKLKEHLMLNYSVDFAKTKNSNVNKRYTISHFIEILDNKKYIDKFKDIESLMEDLINKNNVFAKHIDYQNYDLEDFYKDEWHCVSEGRIFPLINNNFIEYLSNNDIIPNHEPFKNKKKKISPKLRILVWKKEYGDDNTGKCPKCNIIINNNANGFHCGHITSEFNGGLTSLENLRPICANCNYKMGKNNWV